MKRSWLVLALQFPAVAFSEEQFQLWDVMSLSQCERAEGCGDHFGAGEAGHLALSQMHPAYKPLHGNVGARCSPQVSSALSDVLVPLQMSVTFNGTSS